MGKKKNLQCILKSIAEDHHTTVSEIYREMEVAIQAGFNNPDPKVQAQWNKIPRKGDIPTPEELIIYVARRAKHSDAAGLFKLSFM